MNHTLLATLRTRKAALSTLLALAALLVGCALKQWLIPYQISDPSAQGDAFLPVLAQDKSGTITAIWQQQLDGRPMIMTSRFNGLLWSAPTQIDARTDTSRSFGATVGVDGGGVVTAAWLQSNDTGFVVNVSRYSADHWSAPVQIDSANDIQPDNPPQIVVDEDGTVTIAWDKGNQHEISVARFSGNTWTQPVTLSLPSMPADAPALTADKNGTVTLAWSQSDGMHKGIYARRFDHESGLWSSAVRLSAPSDIENAYSPRVVADASGNVTAIWHQIGVFTGVYASHFSNGAWSSPKLIDGPSAAQPALTVDSIGNVTAAWSAFNGARTTLKSSRYSNGSWSAPIQVDGLDASLGHAYRPFLVADATGIVTIAWAQTALANNQWRETIFASRYSNNSWSKQTQIDHPSSIGASASPTLVADTHDNLTSAWFQADSNNRYVINVNHFK